jgi:hypothetical protein
MTVLDTTPYTHDGMPVLRLLGDLIVAAGNSLAQTSLGIPRLVGLYHDTAPEDCDSALIMWVREWVPVTLGQFPLAASAVDLCKPIDMIPRVVVSLRRPCAPLQDERGRVDTDAEEASAEDLILDARALTCGMFATWPPILHANYPGARILWGSMIPTGASSDIFGWDMEVLLELYGCRGGCGQ